MTAYAAEEGQEQGDSWGEHSRDGAGVQGNRKNRVHQTPFFEARPENSGGGGLLGRKAGGPKSTLLNVPSTRAFLYKDLAGRLRTDEAFWKTVGTRLTDAQLAFTYAVLNGMEGSEALRLVFGTQFDQLTPDRRQRVLRRFERQAGPALAFAFLEAGMSKFWLVQRIKSFIEDKAADGPSKVRAMELAARITGTLADAQVVRTREISRMGDQERVTIREEVSRTIQASYGNLLPMPLTTVLDPQPDDSESQEHGYPALILPRTP